MFNCNRFQLQLSKPLPAGLQEWFNALSLTELEVMTEYPKSQWCRWFRGSSVGEAVLRKAASRLCEHLPTDYASVMLTPGLLLDLIDDRRKATEDLSTLGLNYTPKQYTRVKMSANSQSCELSTL